MRMNLAKVLISAGVFLVVAGGLVWLSQKLPSSFRLGHLPGDLRIEGKNGGFCFPLVTCLVLSVLASIILHIIRRFF